jgi:hypothetical protein
MKTTLVLASLLLAAPAFAADRTAPAPEEAARKYVGTPEDAIAEASRGTGLLKVLEKSGYTLEAVTTQQIYYFVIPSGDFEWGTMTYLYKRLSRVSVGSDSASLAFTLHSSPETGFYVSCTSLTACDSR